ncbi:MAG: U32 family peptidase [Dethiobacteria bacterium]|nr:U32 family peptidase [Dethiobacteria bacterium]
MELLAPAGNLEKLKSAVRFGADAVYCGAGAFSLRAPETSFSLDELAAGVHFAHNHDCQVYLAMNIFAFDEDIAEMIAYFKQAMQLGIDAVIVSDPGLLAQIRRITSDIKIHLSTQANTTNSESVKFWQDRGVNRIVVARELSLEQIKKIKKNVPAMELEVFVHGAMCIAYSGRCLLSKFFNNRSANRGHCTQPCRWEYRLKETLREEEQTICEDARGTYILNSRDLCMIEHIPALAEAGVDSLKIEGRMKTAYYVAAVTRVYRAALDRMHKQGSAYSINPVWVEELAKVSHRPYTSGFYLPELGDETEYTTDSSYIRGYDFVGTVTQHNVKENRLRVSARNRIFLGDCLEILDPQYPEVLRVKVNRIIAVETGEYLDAAHNGYQVDLFLAEKSAVLISKDAIIRNKSEG